MRLLEIFRLVWLNLSQNKFKVVLTSVGIVVGSATIMMVLAIGTGGKAEVAEQFKNLNAGAIDISYEGGNSGMGFNMKGNDSSASDRAGGGPLGRGSMPSGGDMASMFGGISDGTISYSTTSSVEGGDMDSASYYTVAGVLDNYGTISNLEMAIGDFITEENNYKKEKVCVIGASVANAIFGSAYEDYDSTIYIDDRAYVVAGVLSEMGSVSSGISPDTAIFIPYQTGIKYITGNDISPVVTVIAEDVIWVEQVMADIENALKETYPNTTFTISDAGSKMDAASASNETLTLLLIAMAVIVFIVGGIGIMNVLFVTVKERTNEIGVLKALGCSRKSILLEFLLEASGTSLVGSVIGVLLALAITPLVEMLSMRVELSIQGAVLSLLFGVITGTIFGFYPAYKASRLIPVIALNQE